MRPGWYSDQWGNLHSKARLAEDLQQFGERFGLDLSDVISEFESEEP
jgi:septation ring formation regulator EzrA